MGQKPHQSAHKSGGSSKLGVASGLFKGLGSLTERLNSAQAKAMAAEAARAARKSPWSPISVDFGQSELKVLQIIPGDEPELVAAASVITPDELRDDIHGRLDFQFGELARLVKTGGFKGKRAVCAIPASETFCKHLQLGRAGAHERSQVVEQLLAAELGRDPATLVHRWYPVEGAVGAAASRNEAVVVAACRGLVGKLMNGLRQAKLDPVGMHNEWIAGVRAFDRLNRREEDAKTATLFLDVGNSGARVCVAHGPNLVFARSLEIGGRLFDEGYAAHLGMDVAAGRVERLRRAKPPRALPAKVPAMAGAANAEESGGGANRRQGAAARGLTGAVDLREQELDPGLADSYSILADEVAMCVRYHEALFGPRRLNRAVLFGGEARDGSLCQRIARGLRVPTQVAEPFSMLKCGSSASVQGVDVQSLQSGWVVALGLCQSPTEL